MGEENGAKKSRLTMIYHNSISSWWTETETPVWSNRQEKLLTPWVPAVFYLIDKM